MGGVIIPWFRVMANMFQFLLQGPVKLWPVSVFRSSHPHVHFKKAVVKNFTKLTGKQLCRSLCNFIKKETPKQVLPCEFCEIFKSNYFLEHLWGLLLNVIFCRFLISKLYNFCSFLLFI